MSGRTRGAVALPRSCSLPPPPLPAHAADLPAGFVRLADIDPTIRQDIRYAGSANFLGRPAKGYEAAACILTEPAAKALASVQKKLAAEGLTLVVFDCYRPIRAVDDFVAWTRTGWPAGPALVSEGQARRPDRRRLYRRSAPAIRAAPRSTWRSALPTLMPPPRPIPIAVPKRPRTLDFGTGFDCFDRRSYTAHSPLPAAAVANRNRLVAVMQQAGFRNYSHEWWHFTLKNEPHKEQRFDFPVK